MQSNPKRERYFLSVTAVLSALLLLGMGYLLSSFTTQP